MNIIFRICIGLSMGVVSGFLAGSLKFGRHKSISPLRMEKMKKIADRFAFILKYITFLLLCLGFIWCIYFLILGAVVPQKTDYANSMSELIVCVLTVISIIFAFIEFSRRTND